MSAPVGARARYNGRNGELQAGQKVVNSGAPQSGDSSLLVCIRVPKSGSASLMRGLEAAFADRRIFYLPNTLDPDGRVSRLYRLRFWRARFQNLFRHYRRLRLDAIGAQITRQAAPGDLLMGGHVDFRTACAVIPRSLRMITLLRDPLTRARSEYDYMRRSHSRKSRLNRFDASVLHKAAARYDFDSYLTYLFDLRHIYGDIACQYVGWDGSEELSAFFLRNVFHWGVLERSEEFAQQLSGRLGRPFSLPHDNREPLAREPLTSAQRIRLEAIYPRDMELYEWVNEQYRPKLSSPVHGEIL